LVGIDDHLVAGGDLRVVGAGQKGHVFGRFESVTMIVALSG
jgi:hypothetical protein